MNHVTSSNQWLVVMSKPKMEIKAKEHLLNQNFQVYLPMWVNLKLIKMKWVKVITPMFPRYLFVRPSNENQSLSPIRSTLGVSQFLYFGSEPAKASDELIHQIQRIADLRQQDKEELKPFKKGDQVQLIDGPFKGNFAKVLLSDQDRVTLLLKILGQNHKLEFENHLCNFS